MKCNGCGAELRVGPDRCPLCGAEPRQAAKPKAPEPVPVDDYQKSVRALRSQLKRLRDDGAEAV